MERGDSSFRALVIENPLLGVEFFLALVGKGHAIIVVCLPTAGPPLPDGQRRGSLQLR
jgi:hypothetical protein